VNEPALVVDCRGMLCPLPVIELARRIAEVPIGGIVRVLADDPAARTDIPAWCRMRNQEFLPTADEGAYDIRRTS
jgi:tRNA 2-thiouridine synthesizing protein A